MKRALKNWLGLWGVAATTNRQIGFVTATLRTPWGQMDISAVSYGDLKPAAEIKVVALERALHKSAVLDRAEFESMCKGVWADPRDELEDRLFEPDDLIQLRATSFREPLQGSCIEREVQCDNPAQETLPGLKA